LLIVTPAIIIVTAIKINLLLIVVNIFNGFYSEVIHAGFPRPINSKLKFYKIYIPKL
jgi:hypothetical protein